jgi:hypothetical protein
MEKILPSKKTCRHYRHRVPSDLADELWAADPEKCEVCDPIMARRGFPTDKKEEPALLFSFFENN